MENSERYPVIKSITAVSFLVMVLVNALANILPINGVTTGGVSDSYPNLFAPAGPTFAIWGIIYLLLGGYTLYHVGLFHGKTNTVTHELLRKTGILFSISSIANAAWIFSWHHYRIALSMLLMVVILACLVMIHQEMRKKRFSAREYFLIKLPFSVYFGWITVATVANFTTLLVGLGWSGLGLPEPIWTSLLIVLGLIIAVTIVLNSKDAAYGYVIVWAYAGILLRHLSPEGFAARYPVVVVTAILCIVVLLLAEGYLLSTRAKT